MTEQNDETKSSDSSKQNSADHFPNSHVFKQRFVSTFYSVSEFGHVHGVKVSI